MNEELIKKINDLEEKVRKLENHQHLEGDGSKELSSGKITAKEIKISGAGTAAKDFMSIPFVISDAEEIKTKMKRGTGIGMAVVNEKDAADEQVRAAMVTGKQVKLDGVVPSNKTDFDEFNFAQLELNHNPQGAAAVSGPSVFPPFAFLVCRRTPSITGKGTIVVGGDTLTDSSADFKNNLVISRLVLASTLESRMIVSNTSNEITIDGVWESPTGEYDYLVVTPIFLGSAETPFTRLYVGDDIRLGYGSSGGSQTRYIKWGAGSPEGVIIANIGSLYLRTDGSTSTTLYIKTANNGLATGWTAK
jgi:hypothetical protein